MFDTDAWVSLFGNEFVRYGIFEKGGELIGGFALYRERKYGLTLLRNAPFTPCCGPFLKIKATSPVGILDSSRKTIEAMADFLERQTHALIFLKLNPGIRDTLPFYWRRFKVIPVYTYILPLSSSLERIKKNMAPVRRRNISKGIRDGLSVRRTTDLNIVRSLVLQTHERQKKQINEAFLEAILFRFANETNSFAFATYRDDVPVACSLIVHDRRTAYYLLGGYNSEKKHHGAGALAMFQAIQHAQQLKLQAFDFEGSMIPAIERYFRGFGGQLTPYFSVNKAWLPVEIVLKFLKREIF
jgi:hypothetical protein